MKKFTIGLTTNRNGDFSSTSSGTGRFASLAGASTNRFQFLHKLSVSSPHST
jgi:hypothetical protein